ncbi:MAG TPA: hypothetical protein VGJ21_26360 [Terracidiphilus sp.]|jgi:tetratricopeptide (TPR) repeat protein
MPTAISHHGQRDAAVASRKLISWKAISSYLECDERTAKRWEQDRQMPVHRAPGGKRSGVFAYTAELDAWLCPGLPPGRSGSHPFSVHAEVAIDPQGEQPPVRAHGKAMFEAADRADSPRISTRPRWIALGAVCILIAVTAVLVEVPGLSQLWKRHANVSGATPPAVPAEAEQLYLRGRYLWNLRTADSLGEAIDSYRQAIAIYPSYAEAYAGLAESYDLLPQFGNASLGDALTKAKEAADRAIDLNPNLASAHTAKAFALFFWDWDITASDGEFKIALALDPNSAQTHHWYASSLQTRLEGVECLKQIDEALRLDPTSAAIATDAASFHANFGDLDAGIAALKGIDRTQPDLSLSSQLLQTLYFATGDYAAYVADFRRYASITRRPDDLALANAMERGWNRAGKRGLLEARAKAQLTAFHHGTESGYYLGETLVLLGRRAEALRYFQAAVKVRIIPLVSMQESPWAKPLASDPGYAALFADIRRQIHGDIAHPAVAPVFLRQPE